MKSLSHIAQEFVWCLASFGSREVSSLHGGMALGTVPGTAQPGFPVQAAWISTFVLRPHGVPVGNSPEQKPANYDCNYTSWFWTPKI